jgi:hypothetical protein
LDAIWITSVGKEFEKICKDGVSSAMAELGEESGYNDWHKSYLEWAPGDENLLLDLKRLELKFSDMFGEIKTQLFGSKGEASLHKWKLFLKESKLVDFFAASIYNTAKCSFLKMRGVEKVIVTFSETGKALMLDLTSKYPVEEGFLVFDKKSVMFHNHSVSTVWR